MCQQLSPRSPPYTTSGTNPVPPPPPYYPMPLLPPPPFAPSSWPGPSGPFKCHSLSTHLLFRFPVHRLYIHWSRHSLSLPCSFCPSSVLWTSVGQGPLIPSAFYTPPALNYPPPPPLVREGQSPVILLTVVLGCTRCSWSQVFVCSSYIRKTPWRKGVHKR